MEVSDEIRRAVQHAVCAVGLREGAVRYPDAARGLNKAAAFHSQRSQALLGEFISRQEWCPGRLTP